MFERITDDVWTTPRSQRFWGVECGTRMTVVRLRDGGLFVHCPVALDDATRRAVDQLGEVRVVAASSLFHHLYVGDWIAAYPGALIAGCPRLAKKRPDLAFVHELSNDPHALWANDLEQLYFSARFEHEVVFFHRRTGTMICADALLNLSEHPSLGTRIAARLMANNAPGKGWLEYFAVQRWADARSEVEQMLKWPIERIVLAHGSLVPSGGREALRHAYAWLP